jgi:hypothetical protein
MAEEDEYNHEEGDEYLVMKAVESLQGFLDEFENLQEEEPEKKDLSITHQAYSANFDLLTKDNVLRDKSGRFFIKGPQAGKRLVDKKVTDLFRKHADIASAEGCYRLASLFEAHAVIYELGYGSTLSFGIVEQMRQHFLPGDTYLSQN